MFVCKEKKVMERLCNLNSVNIYWHDQKTRTFICTHLWKIVLHSRNRKLHFTCTLIFNVSNTWKRWWQQIKFQIFWRWQILWGCVSLVNVSNSYFLSIFFFSCVYIHVNVRCRRRWTVTFDRKIVDLWRRVTVIDDLQRIGEIYWKWHTANRRHSNQKHGRRLGANSDYDWWIMMIGDIYRRLVTIYKQRKQDNQQWKVTVNDDT